MKLNEYQAKLRLAEAGIPIPESHLAATPEEARTITEEFNAPVYVKAQIPISGRFHLGGVRHAMTADDAFGCAMEMLHTTIKGLPINHVLVEKAIDTLQELYIGITYDRTISQPVIIMSSEGGAELETIAQDKPDTVFKEAIAPLIGLRGYQVTTIASKMNLPRDCWPALKQIALSLYDCFVNTDAELIELNPLAVTPNKQLIALDAKMIVDENALYRQPVLRELAASNDRVEERHARTADLSYIKLDGQVGCVFNGADIAMTAMDLIHIYGNDDVRPANFMDVGGSASLEKWQTGLRIVLKDTDTRSVLVSVFGGTTRCDHVARALIAAQLEDTSNKPIVIRLRGTQAAHGLQMISDAQLPNVYFAETLTEAVVTAIKLATESG